MAKIQIPKKIRAEDFKAEDQELVGKLAFALNDFMDGVYSVFNGGIDFENLNRQVTTVTVNIDKDGKIANAPQIKLTVNGGRIKGINVLNAVNVNNTSVFPVSSPFISYSTASNLLTILNITGLQANSQYQLTLELVA